MKNEKRKKKTSGHRISSQEASCDLTWHCGQDGILFVQIWTADPHKSNVAKTEAFGNPNTVLYIFFANYIG